MNVAKRNEVFRTIIKHYERAIAECPKDKWYRFICEKKMHHGICFFSYHVLRETITNLPIVDRIAFLLGDGMYWYREAIDSENHPEAIKALQVRVNILKAIVHKKKVGKHLLDI